MCKHGDKPSRGDKHVTLAAISPPGVARGRFVRGHQTGPAGGTPPPLFKRGASPCSSQGQCQQEPWGASPRPSAPTYLPLREEEEELCCRAPPSIILATAALPTCPAAAVGRAAVGRAVPMV